MIVDRGPWSLSYGFNDTFVVASDDFTYDVVLRIDGDFADDKQMVEYAEWLVWKLNAPITPQVKAASNLMKTQ